MALNPPLSNQGVPFRLQDEFVLVERKGMDIEVKVPNMSKLSGKGTLYLTTARLIFVNKNFTSDKFKAMDMPVAMMSHVDFKQPVFGSNYLMFTCKPLFNLLPGEAEVKLWFTQGGCDKFLRIFEHVTKQIYEQKKAQRLNNDLLNQWNNGYFNNKAFYDPSDPTVVFTEQPPVFKPDQPYIGNNIFVTPNVNYPSMSDSMTNNPHNMNTPNNFNNYQPNMNTPQNFHLNQPQQNMPQGFINNQPQINTPQGFSLNQPQPNEPQGFVPNQPHYNMTQGSNLNRSNNQNPNGYQQNIPQNFIPNQPQYNTPQDFNLNQPQMNTPQGFNLNQPNNQNPQGFIANGQQHNADNLPQMNNPQIAMNQDPNAAYYFGFFGPQLKRND